MCVASVPICPPATPAEYVRARRSGVRCMCLAALSGRLLTALLGLTTVIIACSEWASGAGLLILSADLLYDATAIEQAIATRRARTARARARARSLRRTCRTCTARARHGACCCALITHYSVRSIAYACACRHAVAHALGSVWMRSYVHARSWSDEWISLGLATYGAKLCLRELAGTRSAAVHCAAAARVR